MTSKIYIASAIPRFIRTTRLGYIPLKYVLGSRLVGDSKNATLIYDIIMLPEPEFTRARRHAGMQHVLAPTPHIGATMPVGVLPSDIKQVTVPENEPDAEGFARAYFMKAYHFDTVDQAGDTTA